MTRPPRDDHGSMAIELVILTPVLVACILLIAAGARIVDARGQAADAAYAAARAGSLTSDQSSAIVAGRRAAARSLTQRGLACASLTVTIDARSFGPGGTVTATITCTADLSDLTGLGLPGHEAFTATASAPLEQYREYS